MTPFLVFPPQDRLEALLDCPVSYVGLSGWTTDQLVKERVRSTRARPPLGQRKCLL